MSITVPEIIQAFVDEDLSASEITVLSARAVRKLSSLPAVIAWLEANPPTYRGKPYHWSLYCVSGYGMPPHPAAENAPPYVQAVLTRLFNWLWLVPDFGLTGPYPLSKVRQALRG